MLNQTGGRHLRPTSQPTRANAARRPAQTRSPCPPPRSGPTPTRRPGHLTLRTADCTARTVLILATLLISTAATGTLRAQESYPPSDTNPAPSPVPAPAQPPYRPETSTPSIQTSVAFLPLDSRTGYSSHDWMRTAFPEIVGAKVTGCPSVHVMETEAITDTLRGSDGRVPERLTAARVMAAARRLHADLLVWGTIEKSATSLTVTLTFTRGEDGHTVERTAFQGDYEAPWTLLGDMAGTSLSVAGCVPDTAQQERIDAQAARDRYALTLFGRALCKRHGVGTPVDLEAARQDLMRALRIDPWNAVMYHTLARLLLETGDSEGAGRAAYQALELWPDDPVPHRVLARLLEEKNALEDAAEHLEAVLDTDPGDRLSRLELARILSRLNRVAEARATVGDVLATDPPPEVATQALKLEARLAALDGDLVSALLAYQRLLELDPGDADTVARLAACYLARGDLETAEDRARLLVRLRRESPLSYHLLGEIELLRDKVPDAVEAFQEEAALDPSRSAAWSYLAEALRRANDLPGRLDALETLAVADPLDPVPLNDLAVLRYEARDFEGAVALLDRAIELAPGWALLHQNLGMALAAQGESERAFEALLTAVHLDPGLPMAQYHLGLLLAARDDLEGATTAFQAAVRAVNDSAHRASEATLHPVLEPALFNLGVVAVQSGQTTVAIRAFEQYLRIAPDAREANLLRQWIDHLTRQAARDERVRPKGPAMR